MTSNKGIASGILQAYAGANRIEVERMLVQAAGAARSDQRAKTLKIMMAHKKLLREAYDSTPRADKMGRFKIARSIKTIDALLEML